MKTYPPDPLPLREGGEINGSPLRPSRTATIDRTTAETEIHLMLDLDGSGKHAIDTGIGFLDHMLAQLAYHGLLDLELRAQGDLHIDTHHTVEDVALVLGQAVRQALGDRRGIRRMAAAYVPMDESLARVVIDFSGRGYAKVQAEWHAPLIGGMATSLFAHFLETFAVQAGCNLHAQVLYGRDDHHQAEALFKALARAMEEAIQIDPRRQGALPSTKGRLE